MHVRFPGYFSCLPWKTPEFSFAPNNLYCLFLFGFFIVASWSLLGSLLDTFTFSSCSSTHKTLEADASLLHLPFCKNIMFKLVYFILRSLILLKKKKEKKRKTTFFNN